MSNGDYEKALKSYEQAHTLILEMQEATTTKTTIKKKIIEKNVVLENKFIDCTSFNKKSHHN